MERGDAPNMPIMLRRDMAIAGATVYYRLTMCLPDIHPPAPMTPPIDRLVLLRELATADVSVLLGVPITERERRIILRVVDLMHSVAHNVEAENLRLVMQIREYERRDAERGDGPQMGVMA